MGFCSVVASYYQPSAANILVLIPIKASSIFFGGVSDHFPIVWLWMRATQLQFGLGRFADPSDASVGRGVVVMFCPL
jgi:hypothetical protein